MRARALLFLAVALPLLACAAPPGATPGAAAETPPAAAQDTRAHDAGLGPASAIQAPAPGAVPAVAADAVPAAAPAPAPVPVAAPSAQVTMPSGSATGSLLQTMFALIAVLALLAAMAWFLKRYGPRTGGGTANLRIVGSLGLGGRERLLVVEVGDQWIVVGASPGRVNALATMPRQDGATAAAGEATLSPHTQGPANNFADWLKQTIDKRK